MIRMAGQKKKKKMSRSSRGIHISDNADLSHQLALDIPRAHVIIAILEILDDFLEVALDAVLAGIGIEHVKNVLACFSWILDFQHVEIEHQLRGKSCRTFVLLGHDHRRMMRVTDINTAADHGVAS